MRELSIVSSAVAVALLLSMLLCQVAVATPPGGTLLFSSGYGGDPGPDELMFTPDDLTYTQVLTDVAASKIAVLTVDCQTGTWPHDYVTDAHNNFDYIATQTKGVHYYSTTTWQTIRDEIQSRVGNGKGDIVFIFDLSASMYGILPTMETNAKNIIDGLSGDVAFGVGSHVDYPHSYTSYYGYTAIYGWTGDYAWSLDQDITTNSTTAKGAIDALGNYGGADGPQNYARVLYESQFYSWRHKATRIVVICGDAPSHAAPMELGTITGGGWIASGDKKAFHLNVRGEPSAPTGELRYVVHKGYHAGMRVDSVSIDYLSFYHTPTGAGAWFNGTCTVDGATGYTFIATVEDNGEPGKNVDFFDISVSDTGFSYSASGLIQGGNIQIHGP